MQRQEPAAWVGLGQWMQALQVENCVSHIEASCDTRSRSSLTPLLVVHKALPVALSWQQAFGCIACLDRLSSVTDASALIHYVLPSKPPCSIVLTADSFSATSDGETNPQNEKNGSFRLMKCWDMFCSTKICRCNICISSQQQSICEHTQIPS